MEEIRDDSIPCIHCNFSISREARFCSNCGSLQEKDYTERSSKQGYWLGSMIIFFVLELIVCLVANFNDTYGGIGALLVYDIIFIVIAVVWTGIMWEEVKPLLRWNNFSIVKVLLYSVAAIAGAIVVNFIVTWLNRSIFNMEEQMYEAFAHLNYPKLIMILMIAVQPALFEELSYRGIMQTGLGKVIEPRQAVYVSSFLFAIIHMSFISLFWLIPFAIILGNIRLKENTIWYGVIIHFCFNATACVLEFF
jgi:uncharacterized protein